VEVRLEKGGRMLFVKGWLEDQRVRRLCGVANSFPDRFLRELELPVPVKDLKFNYNPKDRVLDIIIDKGK
jgi:hypothetical protein